MSIDFNLVVTIRCTDPFSVLRSLALILSHALIWSVRAIGHLATGSGAAPGFPGGGAGAAVLIAAAVHDRGGGSFRNQSEPIRGRFREVRSP
jgi:hypothetical protein